MASRDFNGREIMVDLRDALDEDVHEIALAVLTNVVIGTPVGNPTLWQNPDAAEVGYVGGHARRNWQVAARSASNNIIGQEGNGPGEGSTQEAINAGRRPIRRFTIDQRRLFIFNNVPYIGRLNAGHSTQAPPNFVDKAVQRATRPDNSRRVI